MNRLVVAAAGLALAAALTVGSQARASTVNYVKDYGTGVMPVYGGAGLMSANSVLVRDVKTGDNLGNRFYDTIAFDNSGPIDSLKLTLSISSADNNSFMGASNFLGFEVEDWRVYGSNNGGTNEADRSQLGSGLDNGSSWVVTLLAGSGSIFTQAVTTGIFAFWFGDEGFLPNDFNLDSATLSVTTAVPLPAGVLLLGSGLGALGLFGWRKKRAAGVPVLA